MKHSAGFPEASVRACLETGGVSISAVDHIAVSSKPISHLEEDVLFALSGAIVSVELQSFSVE